jgi:uncharacterized protein (TIGR02246 family)
MVAESDQEIAALVQHLADAWNAGDAEAWVRDCLEDCDFINIRGDVMQDRLASQMRHAGVFAGPFRGSRISMSVRRVRRLGSDAAVVDTDCRVTGAPGMPNGIQATEPGVLVTRLKHVLVRVEGRWRIAASQNTAVSPLPP